jgi:hypothetical protein
MKTTLRLMALGLLLACPALARAQLDFTLNLAVQFGQPGDTLTFAGTLTNTGATELFLNGDDFTLNGDGLTLDDTPFLTGAPLSLDANQSFTGPIFTVAIDPDAPFQSAQGSFSILGGATDSAQDTLATQTFTVGVVPEPGALALLMGNIVMGGLALGARIRRQRSER